MSKMRFQTQTLQQRCTVNKERAHILRKHQGLPRLMFARMLSNVNIRKVPWPAISTQPFFLDFLPSHGSKGTNCYRTLLMRPSRFKLIKISPNFWRPPNSLSKLHVSPLTIKNKHIPMDVTARHKSSPFWPSICTLHLSEAVQRRLRNV